MPNTTNFNFPTPADTDLVKDGASAIRSLGDSIDSTFAELKGGTTGQVLSKTSNTDMDFTWVAQDDSNAIQNAIVDAKGDLISATAADTPARLAVGTNGQILTANSSTSTGLEWQTLSSSAPPTLVPQNSLNIVSVFLPTGGGLGSQTLTLNQLYFIPVYLSGVALDRIQIRTASGFSGTTSMRLGLYNASVATGKPTTVVFDAGTVSCTAASTTYSIIISQTPSAGWYYLASVPQSISGTASFAASDDYSSNVFLSLGSASSNGFYYQSSVTGALPTAGTLVASSGTFPISALRIA